MRRIRPMLLLPVCLALGCAGPPVDQTASQARSCGEPEPELRWEPTCGHPVCFFPEEVPEGMRVCDPTVGEESGQPCAVADDSCFLGCGARLVCSDVPLIDPHFGCPISTREAKNDISYLTPADETRVAAELRNMRLATYRYKGALDDGRDHLGFIIEDDPRSPAVHASGKMVDLYNYTSMVVAALQVQARETEALKQEVARLRKQLAARRGR